MPCMAWSHEGHHSNANNREPVAIEKKNDQALATIAASYKVNVEASFKKACFDCHGQTNKLPWYYSVPGVGALIDSDIKEAKTHLDFSYGYPFKGHGTPLKDLEAIEKAIKDHSMPPTRYTIMHSSSRLSLEEEKGILDWIQESQTALAKKPN